MNCKPIHPSVPSRGRIVGAIGLLAVLTGLGATYAGAQASSEARGNSRSPSDTTGSAGVYFDKLLSTYHWLAPFVYRGATANLSFDINQLFRSTLVRTTSNLITDEESFRGGLRLHPGGDVDPVARLNAYVLSDRRGFSLSNVSTVSFHAGAAYRPAPALTIEPLVGYRRDRQSGISDGGLSYILRVNADSIDYEGYVSTLGGSWEVDRLDPRALETGSAQFSTRKAFPGNSSNALGARYSRNRRDFYTPAGSGVAAEFGVDLNIESRVEDLFSVTDSLLYTVSDRLAFTVNAGILSRGIGRESKYKSYADPLRPTLNTSVDELTIGGEFSAALALSDAASGRLIVVLQERNETHQASRDDGYLDSAVDSLRRVEERKNNVSRRTSIAFETTVRFSPSHSVSASASGTILRYDTPSASNTDDRDDLWYLLRVFSRHRLSGYLTVTLTADASLTHLVYLSSQRSADNTWNRIFRLSPEIVYRPFGFLISANRFEVLANYTVYDFDTPGNQVRSYAFRQFAMADSTVFTLSKKTWLEWNTTVRLYERGNLRWSDFSERPVSYFEDFSHLGLVRHRLAPALIFSLGIRYFSQMRFDYQGFTRVPAYFLRSVGPATLIDWSVTERTALSLKGWYERQSQTNRPDHGIANITMSLNLSL